MRTQDGTGSGYAAIEAPRLADVDAAALAERAAVKAETSAKPRDLPPGEYPVILEPQAVADLLGGIVFSFDARSAEEGRSYFSKPGGGTESAKKSSPTTSRSAPTRPTRAFPARPGPVAAEVGFFGPGGGSGGLPAARPPGSKTASCAT